jgi:hypothetical protein
MNNPESIADRRGGGDRARVDAFHFAPGKAHYAFAAVAGLGIFAIAAAVFDLGDAQAKGQAVWLAPAGVFLLLAALGLYWLRWRKPALLAIGPEGLDLPAALVQPVAWREIWRLRCTRRRVTLQPDFIMLKIELGQGVRPRYQRRLWTMPLIDGWIARKWGLSVPLHNLDAGETTILASIERFRPVQRVTT